MHSPLAASANNVLGDLELGLLAVVQVLECDGQLMHQVLTSARSSIASLARIETAEELREDVEGIRSGTSFLQAVFAVFIVQFSLFGIAKSFVGLTDELELQNKIHNYYNKKRIIITEKL